MHSRWPEVMQGVSWDRTSLIVLVQITDVKSYDGGVVRLAVIDVDEGISCIILSHTTCKKEEGVESRSVLRGAKNDYWFGQIRESWSVTLFERPSWTEKSENLQVFFGNTKKTQKKLLGREKTRRETFVVHTWFTVSPSWLFYGSLLLISETRQKRRTASPFWYQNLKQSDQLTPKNEVCSLWHPITGSW